MNNTHDFGQQWWMYHLPQALTKKLDALDRDIDNFSNSIGELAALSHNLVDRNHYDSENIKHTQVCLQTVQSYTTILWWGFQLTLWLHFHSQSFSDAAILAVILPISHFSQSNWRAERDHLNMLTPENNETSVMFFVCKAKTKAISQILVWVLLSDCGQKKIVAVEKIFLSGILCEPV